MIELVNQNSPAEGLLMNVRVVNAVFEDQGNKLNKYLDSFDPAENTSSFIGKLPDYLSYGVNAFTISLQGGFPGYEGAINSAFNSNGTLRDSYMSRVERIIKKCDQRNAVVILSCLYQRQHGHSRSLNHQEAIINAIQNVSAWIKEHEYGNVLLEIANEYPHSGYQNWPDGNWLTSSAGQLELIEAAKAINENLLVSTSGLGDGEMPDSLAREVDFILIHFNNTPVEDIADKINQLKKYNKPIVCNEDHKTGAEAAASLKMMVLNQCGGGYMNIEKNQMVPFEFSGPEDDQ
ncbi:MAG: cellulase family glycosylhydrolase, partial [Candidatus Cyclobacteriaceae bacterium M3_2C_046]